MKSAIELQPEIDDESPLNGDWVDLHGNFLFKFAIGQVRDVGTAEDLVQETFLAAVKGRDKFLNQSSERTWLVGILRHKIFDHLRRTCRERAVRVEPAVTDDNESWEDSAFWLHEMAAEAQSPSRRMELAEFRKHLELALGTLPTRVAQVFQLYAVEDRTNSEVCREMNISQSNLWVMLHRARNQLREQLGAWRADSSSHKVAVSQIHS